MKSLILLFVFSMLAGHALRAQEPTPPEETVPAEQATPAEEPRPGGDEYVTLVPVTVGRDLIGGGEMQGTEYDFGVRVEHAYIDSLSRTATIELRPLAKNEKYLQNRGMMLVLDLQSGRVRWTREVVYPGARSGVTQNGDFLVYNNGKKSFCLSLMDGQPRWESKYDFWYMDLDSAKRIGCGYPSQAGMYAPGMLHGISLDTGDRLWKRRVFSGNGWENIQKFDDSTVLVQASGLHRINLFTGEGWDYDAMTVQPVENVKRWLTASSGLKSSTFWRGGVWGPGLIRGLASDPVVTEDAVFFSSRDKVISLDRNDGTLRWEQPLPEGVASYSHLFEGDSVVYLVGRGFAFLQRHTITYGRPFFAAYSKWDGRPVFSEVIDQRKCQVRAMDFRQDSLVLVTEDRIDMRSLENGRSGREIAIDTSLYGAVVRDVDPERFFRRDSLSGRFSQVVNRLDSWGVFTTKDKLLLLGGQLEIKETLDLDSLYYLCDKHDNLSLLRRDSTTCLVDDNGTVRAELVSAKTPKWVGDYLFIASPRGLIRVDVSGIVKNRYLNPDASSAPLAAWRRKPQVRTLLTD